MQCNEDNYQIAVLSINRTNKYFVWKKRFMSCTVKVILNVFIHSSFSALSLNRVGGGWAGGAGAYPS